MEVHDIKNVQDSFSKVLPISEVAADLFYTRLFEIAPQVRPLFKSDLKEQGKKLMQMLTVVVGGLDDLPKLIPAAENLAINHVGYGVENDHYALVGEALIWTLGQGLGQDFTPDIRSSWEKTYAALSSVMIDAASREMT